jgi:23S rRNA (guanine2445-N2)-methyltransferase / 23S rRNA (guanine2069-N7)-methyltransferase
MVDARVFDTSPEWRDKCVLMFSNRLGKNAKHLRKWAKREGLDAYRCYDQDIPEVPIVVDIYDGAAVIGDYRMHDDDGARRGGDDWLDAMATATSRTLGIAANEVFVKGRMRLAHHGEGQQYRRLADDVAHRVVHEAGLSFIVNLSDFVDTGLFLDHRVTRRRVASETFDHPTPRMLNLFCYTGAFSVHAAAAGMNTTSVDMSRTYIDWAAANFSENHMDTQRHRLVQSDVQKFLAQAHADRERFDIAVVDPPTFSNSKRMDYTWDVQRDHPGLLSDVAGLMAPGGVIWFSTNRRKFTLQIDGEPAFDGGKVTDETAATIPADFRDQKVHRAFRIVMPR